MQSTLREVITLEQLSGTYEEISAYLNERPLIANPEPQADIPKAMTISDIFALITPQDIEVVKGVATLLEAGAAISQSTGIPFESTPERMLGMLVAQGLSTTAQTAITAKIAETEPDPTYQAQIPGPARYELLEIPGPISAVDVQGALNGID